jgi:hypothetical protein
MRKIVCYRRGCNNRAQWTIPGRQPVHLCTKHMRELFPNQNITAQQIVVGPTEFKKSEDDNGEEARTS